MTRRASFSIVATAVVVLVAGPAFAQSGPMQQQYGPHYVGSDRTGAVAALEPEVDDGSWGRLMIRDREIETGVYRDVMGRFYGLAPDAEYTVSVTGAEEAAVVVGVVSTDSEGDAWLRLQSPERNYPEVPPGVPTVSELATATVSDGTGLVVLAGSFIDMPEPPAAGADFVYFERIRLDDPSGGDTRGIARVARDAADVQWFQTHAARLEPRGVYQVVVEPESGVAVTAGIVTAGPAGHGELTLSTSGDGDALPEGLQPIESLRLVQWIAGEGDEATVVLEGAFTGANMVGFGGAHGGGSGWNGEGGPGGPNGDCDQDCDCDCDCDGDGNCNCNCDCDGPNGGDNGGGGDDTGGGGDNGGGDHGHGGSP